MPGSRLSSVNPDMPDNELRQILHDTRRIAVVGLSPKGHRDSNRVAKYLLEKGYDIIPVNPGQREILGRKCYSSLSEIPDPVDMVDIFLNSSRVPPVVDQAISMGVEVIWMQLGITDIASAEKARDKGVRVVMDLCIKQEYERLMKC